MKKMTLQDLKGLFNSPTVWLPFHVPTATHGGKHDASKRGHRHIHGMSRGQRKDAARGKK